jgi:hypothetical protein
MNRISLLGIPHAAEPWVLIEPGVRRGHKSLTIAHIDAHAASWTLDLRPGGIRAR